MDNLRLNISTTSTFHQYTYTKSTTRAKRGQSPNSLVLNKEDQNVYWPLNLLLKQKVVSKKALPNVLIKPPNLESAIDLGRARVILSLTDLKIRLVFLIHPNKVSFFPSSMIQIISFWSFMLFRNMQYMIVVKLGVNFWYLRSDSILTHRKIKNFYKELTKQSKVFTYHGFKSFLVYYLP